MVRQGLVSRVVSWFITSSVPAGNPLDDRYYETSAGYPSRAGVIVSAESARKISAVYRCVSILANVLAMFPKGMYERLERGRREAPDHPLDPLISFKPNRRQTAFEFWRLVCYHLVLRQNAYVQIVPGTPGRGWVGQLVPLHPDRVTGPEELPNGRLRYTYTRPSGEKIPMLGGIDIWHLQGLSDDGLKGMSMIEVAADSIGLSMAAERHAARFFERGVKPTGVLQSERSYKADVAEAMGESFTRKWGGEAGHGKVPVLWEGMKFQNTALNLKDQEFLDSRKFSVAEIARWFGVPPHMVGDVERSTSWGTGIEQQGLHFLIYSLLPWIELIEQSVRYTLVVESARYYMKCNTSALLRMDQETQSQVMATYIEKGVLSPNECRELLDRNPREGGDEYVNPAAKPERALPPAPPSGETPPEDEEQEQARARAAELAHARATDLVAEEARHLRKLAREHAKSSDGWRSAVAGFYGRFAGRISLALACSRDAAKKWCEARRDVVLDAGLVSMTTAFQEQAVCDLKAMAIGGDRC